MTPRDEKRIQTVVRAADDAGLAEALTLLRDGQVVVFPTDTIYGVGCDLWQSEAVARLYEAKRRPLHRAIPVLVSDTGGVSRVARDIPPSLTAVAERFWPGGLTVVLPRRPEVPDILCAGGTTVAVRMPDEPFTRRLIAAMGGALAVTSANLSSRAAACTAQEALTDLGGRVPLVLDGGRCRGGVASSIIDLVSDPPTLLRRGGLASEALRELLPTLVVPE